MFKLTSLAVATACVFLSACSPQSSQTPTNSKVATDQPAQQPLKLVKGMASRLNIYKTVKLTADLSSYSANQKKMIGLLIDAAQVMDKLFWLQAYGPDSRQFLARIANPQARQFAVDNFGPWDRLDSDKPFLQGISEKPAGAQFYPANMTKQEFEQADIADKKGLYSVIRRNEQGKLISIPYSKEYRPMLSKAADLLRQAAKLADNDEFANYLTMRAEALLDDNFQPSDFAWMDMKSNPIELVIGPIETYEDQLFGYRASYEAYVLLKDMDWSKKLAKYAAYLPELQKSLPVDDKYKQEVPGANADLGAYDVIYYGGNANAGGKTIAVNLPNDEQVQLQKGTRRLQLKNAMRAKFDQILLPIANQLVVPEQRKNITFNAFFANTMFHEVAHGLGIKNTLDGKTTVRKALKQYASALEEGKADILGLYMVTQLLDKGVLTSGTLKDYYVTFMTSIFRSVRFGASDAHGVANMIRFNFFEQHGAFSRNADGLYSVNMDKMHDAVNALSRLILTLQGDGDYNAVAKLVADKGVIKPQLAADLKKLSNANIPVDIVFDQGRKVLGL